MIRLTSPAKNVYFYTSIARIGGFVILLEIDIPCNEEYWNFYEFGNFKMV